MKSRLFLTTFLMILVFGITALLMAAPAHTTDNTKNTPDQTLRSNARINPSTLALEFSIPIANFTGRNGLTMPLVFNYSSKLWRFDLQGYGATEGVNFTTNIPRYSEKSAAGWTSSFGIAQIESFEDVYDCAGNPLGEAQNRIPTPVLGANGELPPGYCGTSIFLHQSFAD